MTDKLEERIYLMTKEIGELSGVVTQVSRTQETMADIQKEQIALLRKHDKTESRIERAEKEITRLEARTDEIEDLTKDLRDHNIRFKERRSHFDWWLNNWKSVGLVLFIMVAMTAFIFPSFKSLMPQ